MTLNVGQVVLAFIKTEKGNRLIPVCVVEEMIRRTKDGTETAYLVQVPGRERPMNLNDLTTIYYRNAAEARHTMIEQATRNVNRLVDVALAKANELFPDGQVVDEVSLVAEVPVTVSLVGQSPVDITGRRYIELPDGTKAIVNSDVPLDLL